MSQHIIWALVTGLLGGFGHCLGMCGPLMLSLGLPRQGQRSWLHGVGLISYQLGRVSTYGFVGGLMGLSGDFVSTIGSMVELQKAVGVAAGLMMMALGLGMSGALRLLAGIELRLGARVQAVLSDVLRQPGPGRLYVAGLLLGYLPCGLSYSIFLACAAQPGPLHGSVMALSFGVGTVPAMLSVALMSRWLSLRLRHILYRLGGLSVAAMGLWYVIRALRF